MHRISIFFIGFLVALFYLMLPPLALAQKADDCGTLEQRFKDLGGSDNPEAEELLKKFPRHCTTGSSVARVLNLALVFAGLAAVAAIIYGGFVMITSAGNEEAFGKGKKTVVYAIVGLVVVLLAGTIVVIVTNAVNRAP
jgi:hypothetical protein